MKRSQWSINIQELRNALRTPDRRRVSQDKLSDLLQPFHPERRAVSQTTVGKWEAGQQEPTIGEFEALAALASAMGLRDVSPEWLAFNHGKIPAFIEVLGQQAPALSATSAAAPGDSIPIVDEELPHPAQPQPRRVAEAGRSHQASAASRPSSARGKRRPKR